jgi:hypothetical protein
MRSGSTYSLWTRPRKLGAKARVLAANSTCAGRELFVRGLSVDRETPMLPYPAWRRQGQGGARAWRLSCSSIGKEKVDPRRAYHSWAGNRSIDRTFSVAFVGRRDDKQQLRPEGPMAVGPGSGRLHLGESIAGRPPWAGGLRRPGHIRCPAALVAFTAIGADVVAQARISQVLPKLFILDGSIARLTSIERQAGSAAVQESNMRGAYYACDVILVVAL